MNWRVAVHTVDVDGAWCEVEACESYGAAFARWNHAWQSEEGRAVLVDPGGVELLDTGDLRLAPIDGQLVRSELGGALAGSYRWNEEAERFEMAL
ncbi:hypothetical protein ANRL2_02834 [Anaerolineae bacterium]|nr:hypothetical protein ANRL2_02834 [Anaerolineae bacterium]